MYDKIISPMVTEKSLSAAASLRAASMTPPLGTPAPSRVTGRCSRGFPPWLSERSDGETPKMDAANDLTSSTVVDGVVAIVIVAPYVACSEAGTLTITWLSVEPSSR